MSDPSSRWWSIVRDVLVDEWGMNPSAIQPETPLFTEDVAHWMDWEELLQAVMAHTDLPFPREASVDRMTCGLDLVRMLAAEFGPPRPELPKGA